MKPFAALIILLLMPYGCEGDTNSSPTSDSGLEVDLSATQLDRGQNRDVGIDDMRVERTSDMATTDVGEGVGDASDTGGAADAGGTGGSGGESGAGGAGGEGGMGGQTAADLEPTNVLLLIADDLGLDAAPCYGWPTATANTPHLDAICANGVRFENAWANPICSPTRATILTGRYPFRTGVVAPVQGGDSPGIRLEEFTIPKALDALAPVAYRHANIGKWHLAYRLNGGADNPNQMGYQHFEGLLRGGVPDYYRYTKVVNGREEEIENYVTTDTIDDAIDWLNAGDGHWFLWMGFNAPHAPFHTPPPQLHQQNLPEGEACPAGAERICYIASIEALDAEIGRLLETVNDPNLERTHVIFVGDNGTPGQVIETYRSEQAKNTLYQGGIHVPLVIAGPQVSEPGRTVDAVVDISDLYPTILELAGAIPPADTPFGEAIDGRSLLPYLREPNSPPVREFVLSELLHATQSVHEGRTIRDQQFKLIRWFEGGDALIDLTMDPTESNAPLAQPFTAIQQAAYDRLSAQLDELRQ
ncbi:MAG: sulfatase-like hydrolase/transferase [Myxococcota bacterium]|nr:sulfatase-like hydrolase/transferase [Myxococcota bacterium]